jgi:hypothetical protein
LVSVEDAGPAEPRQSIVRGFQVNSTSIVFDTRHDSALRVAQSMIATKAAPHRDVSDISAPDLVRLANGQIAKQIRMNPVCGVRNRCSWPLVDPSKTHLWHQPAHAFRPTV